MLRRQWLLLAGTAALRADERQELTDWLGLLASRLSEENPEDFLRPFRKDIRERIESNVRALIQLAEIASSIDIVTIGGTEDRRELELDWYLDLKLRASSTAAEKRRQTIKVQLEKVKKGWQIIGFSMPEFFAPPK